MAELTDGDVYPLHERLALAHWRRTVAELYAQVRHAADAEHSTVALRFRQERDRLFREHSQTPLAERQRAGFQALDYFAYDATWRIVGELEPLPTPQTFQAILPEGPVNYTRIARIHFSTQVDTAILSLYWIEGYGGGLFLPFKDATNSHDTYGGGRYLYDSIKGADLGASEQEILLDFNYAYNPSCAYSSLWVCPLPPPENTLPFRVTAGEKSYLAGEP